MMHSCREHACFLCLRSCSIKMRLSQFLTTSYHMIKLKTTYTDSFETMENCKWADKMWKTGNINRDLISCDNLRKEEQISHDCRSETQYSEWKDELKRFFEDWKEKNSNGITRNTNRKPVSFYNSEKRRTYIMWWQKWEARLWRVRWTTESRIQANGGTQDGY